MIVLPIERVINVLQSYEKFLNFQFISNFIQSEAKQEESYFLYCQALVKVQGQSQIFKRPGPGAIIAMSPPP